MKENPYEDMTTERDPMGEFMQTLRREPTPTTEAMQNGIKFEAVSYTHLDVYKRQVGIGVNDSDAILRRQLVALFELLLYGNVLLVVTAVPTVENARLFDFQLLAPLRLRRVLCRFSRQQRNPLLTIDLQ